MRTIVTAAAVVAVGGLVAAGYGMHVANVSITAAGGVAALAGLQCALNAHVALVRQRVAVQD